MISYRSKSETRPGFFLLPRSLIFITVQSWSSCNTVSITLRSCKIQYIAQLLTKMRCFDEKLLNWRSKIRRWARKFWCAKCDLAQGYRSRNRKHRLMHDTATHRQCSRASSSVCTLELQPARRPHPRPSRLWHLCTKNDIQNMAAITPQVTRRITLDSRVWCVASRECTWWRQNLAVINSKPPTRSRENRLFSMETIKPSESAKYFF